MKDFAELARLRDELKRKAEADRIEHERQQQARARMEREARVFQEALGGTVPLAWAADVVGWRVTLVGMAVLTVGVAAAVLAFGLMWVADPGAGRQMRRFGVTLAAATAFHLMIGVAPGRWLTPMCDGISIVYAAAAVGTGPGFAVLPLVRLTANRKNTARTIA